MMEETENEDRTTPPETDSEEVISSPVKRVAMVLFSPQHVFESLRVKSSRLDWIIPLVLSICFSLIILNVGRPYLLSDQLNAATQKIENNAKLSEEQKTAALNQVKEGMEKMGGFTTVMTNVGAVVGSLISLVVFGLIVKAIVVIWLHGTLTFSAGLKIAALSSMVSLLGAIVRTPLIFYFESFTESKLSLGFLFSGGFQDSFLLKVLDFDLFTLWFVIVLSIGMAVFARTRLIKAFLPLLVLWLAYRVAAVALGGWIGSLGA